MPFTAKSWPIAAALLQFPGVKADGTVVQEADAAEWCSTFSEVAEAGFDDVDMTDSWVRVGDLSEARLDMLKAAATRTGVRMASVSTIRRSVIDAREGEANLAYSNRTLDAAAHLGIPVVSFGLHQALTEEQKRQLFFWTAEGHKDPVGDKEVWGTAVRRLRELGRHGADVGVSVSLEMYEDTYVGTADSAVRLVEEIDVENLGLNPDVGNLVRLHRPVEDWREILQKTLPYTNFWHVKNYYRDEDVARGYFVAFPAPMELGIINYRDAISWALANGFQGVICTEHYGGDGLSVSATNQAYLREKVLPKTDGYRLGSSRVRQMTWT
jgi:sugar phosphate isomerase/epimerase